MGSLNQAYAVSAYGQSEEQLSMEVSQDYLIVCIYFCTTLKSPLTHCLSICLS